MMISNADDNDDNYTITSHHHQHIYFSGIINQKSMAQLINICKTSEFELLKSLKKMKQKYKVLVDDLVDEQDVLELFEPKIKPIKLTIHSQGGCVFSALFAVDQIKMLKIPVHTIISGYGASAATILSLAGNKRFITKNSHMLIHEVRSGCWGKRSFIIDNHINVENISEMLIDYYASNTKMTREELPKLLEKDRNWNASECLARGLVDEIL